MRIAITSDLHYGPGRNGAAVDAFVPAVAAARPDLLVIAGDVGEGPEAFEACLRRFASLDCARAVLAGNHDVWSRAPRGGADSRELLDTVLPAIARQCGFVWLETSAWRQGSLAVVGSLAWYDYSAADPAQARSDEEYARRKGEVNADAWFVDWPDDDAAVAARLGDAMIERLEAEAARSDVCDILVVTHVPLFDACMHRRPPEERGAARWNFSNAYFGNLTLGRRVERVTKVRAAVSGHTHFGGNWRVARASGDPIDAHGVASDYGAPALVVVDF